MNFLMRFVENYKEIFDLRKKRAVPYAIKFKDVGMILIMQIMVYALFGFLFNQFHNLYFISLSLNALVIFTGIIIMIKKEITFKKTNQLDYALWVGTIYDISQLIMIVSTVNLVVMLIVYHLVVSVSYLVFLAIVSILSSIVHLSLRRFNYLSTSVHSTNAVVVTFYITLLAITLFYTIGIESILLAYFIVYSLILIGLWLNQKLFNQLKSSHLVILSLAFSFLLLIGLTHALIIENIWFEPLHDTKANLGKSHTISHENHKPYYFTDGSFLYVDSKDFTVYDENLHLVQTLIKDELTEYFVMDETIYKTVLSDNQNDLTIDDYARYDLYMQSNDEFIYIDTMVNLKSLHSPKSIVFFRYQDEMYYTTNHGEYIWALDRFIASNINYTPSRILHINTQHLIFTHNDQLFVNHHLHTAIPYSNSRVGFDLDKHFTCVTNIEHYIEFYPECLGERIKKIEDDHNLLLIDDAIFTYQKNPAQMSNENRLEHINYNGNAMFNHVEGFDDLFYIEETLYIMIESIQHEEDSVIYTNTFYQIDPDDLSRLIFHPQALSIRLSMAMIYFLMLLVPIDLKVRK